MILRLRCLLLLQKSGQIDTQSVNEVDRNPPAAAGAAAADGKSNCDDDDDDDDD